MDSSSRVATRGRYRFRCRRRREYGRGAVRGRGRGRTTGAPLRPLLPPTRCPRPPTWGTFVVRRSAATLAHYDTTGSSRRPRQAAAAPKVTAAPGIVTRILHAHPEAPTTTTTLIATRPRNHNSRPESSAQQLPPPPSPLSQRTGNVTSSLPGPSRRFPPTVLADIPTPEQILFIFPVFRYPDRLFISLVLPAI